MTHECIELASAPHVLTIPWEIQPLPSLEPPLTHYSAVVLTPPSVRFISLKGEVHY